MGIVREMRAAQDKATAEKYGITLAEASEINKAACIAAREAKRLERDKVIARTHGISLENAIELRKAYRSAVKDAKKAGKTGSPVKGTIIGVYVDPTPVVDTKEVGKELSIAHKEVDKALTKGGERDKRKVRPFVTNSYGTIEYKSHIK